MQKFDRNLLFWNVDRFSTIFGQRVNQKPPILALFYFILFFSDRGTEVAQKKEETQSFFNKLWTIL